MGSPLSPSFQALANRVVAEYRAALGDDLIALALFGSVARGEARPISDLDLYVVTRLAILGDPRLRTIWKRIDASPEYQALVASGYRPTPSPVLHTVEDLRRHSWILLDITHHGIVLYDPASVLERELNAVRRRMAELGSRRIELADGSWYWDLKPDWRPGEVVDL
ncbi:MAG TPA: nucleotidyltransferase domain-containing protein [Candidatus Acidoferrum sp.]|nr:nucleotidyltransferase domain-containing protein [Candidatus Acidoferrum sp.]